MYPAQINYMPIASNNFEKRRSAVFSPRCHALKVKRFMLQPSEGVRSWDVENSWKWCNVLYFRWLSVDLEFLFLQGSWCWCIHPESGPDFFCRLWLWHMHLNNFISSSSDLAQMPSDERLQWHIPSQPWDGKNISRNMLQCPAMPCNVWCVNYGWLWIVMLNKVLFEVWTQFWKFGPSRSWRSLKSFQEIHIQWYTPVGFASVFPLVPLF